MNILPVQPIQSRKTGYICLSCLLRASRETPTRSFHRRGALNGLPLPQLGSDAEELHAKLDGQESERRQRANQKYSSSTGVRRVIQNVSTERALGVHTRRYELKEPLNRCVSLDLPQNLKPPTVHRPLFERKSGFMGVLQKDAESMRNDWDRLRQTALTKDQISRTALGRSIREKEGHTTRQGGQCRLASGDGGFE